jgi:hypothetical protein
MMTEFSVIHFAIQKYKPEPMETGSGEGILPSPIL